MPPIFRGAFYRVSLVAKTIVASLIYPIVHSINTFFYIIKLIWLMFLSFFHFSTTIFKHAWNYVMFVYILVNCRWLNRILKNINVHGNILKSSQKK